MTATKGSGARAVKREVPSLAEMRTMDRHTLQMLHTRALDATQSIRLRLHRLEAGLYQPYDEDTLSKTKAALLRWEALPAIIESIQREDEAGPRDELRAMQHSLYRSVGRMFNAYDANPTDCDRACDEVRLHFDLITNHLHPEGINNGDSQEDASQG